MTHGRNVFSARVDDAFSLAREVHEGQYRKGTSVPYLSHVLAVASIVIEFGGDEDEVIAALLHDAPEDCPGDCGGRAVLERIRERFGARVASLVDACTETYERPKPPWQERKQAYVRHAASAEPSVRLIIAADKIHNARSICADHAAVGRAIWNRFNASRKDTMWFYTSVSEAVARDWRHPIVRELQNSIARLSELD